MRVTVVPRVVLHLQYQAVRLPIGVLDTHVLSRCLSAESMLRLPLDRVLGSLDAAAGRLLDDPTRPQDDAGWRPLASAPPYTAQMERNTQHAHGQQQPAAPGPAHAHGDYHDDDAAARGDEQAATRHLAEQAHARAAADKDRADAAARALRRMADAQRSTHRPRINVQAPAA